MILLTHKWFVGVLLGYSFLIVVATLLDRKVGIDPSYNLHLFWSYEEWGVQKEQILGNVIMFIPFGIFGAEIFKWEIIPIAASFSFIIEVIQLISQRGLCEFDDIFHNTIGCAIGFGVYKLIKYVSKRIKNGRYGDKTNGFKE